MARPKAQAVNAINNSHADHMQNNPGVSAPVPAEGLMIDNKHELHCGLIRKSGNPKDKIINQKNVFIALTIMLLLLFSLQSPVCCDGVITSESTLQPILVPPQRPAQVPVTDDHPVTSIDEKALNTLVYTTGVHKQIKTEKPFTASVNTVEAPALVPVDTAPAAGSMLPATAETEEMKTDAATTLAAENQTGFVKLAYSGEILDEEAEKWECVEDRSNMLTWEVKKNDGGIRDRDHSYTWFSELDGVKDGIDNGGRCKGGVSCDTGGYARAMNEQNLCGYSDWRLPTRAELETLIEYNGNPSQATINRTYFPEAVPSWYWSASEHPRREAYAWYVLFRNGVALNDLKERPKHIRLVRGEILQR